MAQINSTVDTKVWNTITESFETINTDEFMLPQNTFAKVRIRTLEQAYRLQERGAKILQTEINMKDSMGRNHRETQYWVLVSWDDIIRCAICR